MLNYPLVLCIVALLTGALGFSGVAGASGGFARMLSAISGGLALLFWIAARLRERKVALRIEAERSGRSVRRRQMQTTGSYRPRKPPGR